MRIHRTNIFAVLLGLDKAFHHFFALAAGKVAGLRADDFNVGSGGYAVGKAFLAVNGDAGAHGPLQFHHVTGLGGDLFHQPFSCDFTFMHAVGRHGCGIQRGIVHFDHPVEQEYRDLGLFGLLQYRGPPGGDYRCNENGINTLGDEGSDRFDLVFLFLLRIGYF
ncbi:hypothetical protein D3C78_1125230 [compost metagenome]